MTAIHNTSRAAHVRDVHLRAVEPTRHATLEQLRRRRTRADQFERLRMFAATRARPPVFAYWSAALIHGLPLLEPPPGTIHVVAAGRTEGAASGVVTHARDQPSCAVVKQGLRATSVAKTVADLAGRTSFLQGVALADAALSTGTWGERTPLVTREDLEEAASAVRDPHERRRAVASVRFADGRAESPLESVSRATIALAVGPPPALQLAVPALFEAVQPGGPLWGLRYISVNGFDIVCEHQEDKVVPRSSRGADGFYDEELNCAICQCVEGGQHVLLGAAYSGGGSEYLAREVDGSTY